MNEKPLERNSLTTRKLPAIYSAIAIYNTYLLSSALLLQLIQLTSSNQFTVISGPSSTGKSSVIRVAADTVSQIPSSGPVTMTTVVTGAMREEELLGYQDSKKGYVNITGM